MLAASFETVNPPREATAPFLPPNDMLVGMDVMAVAMGAMVGAVARHTVAEAATVRGVSRRVVCDAPLLTRIAAV